MRVPVLILLLLVVPVAALADHGEWQGDIDSRDERGLRINVDFPRIADVFGPMVQDSAPHTVSAVIRVPEDAPSDIKAAAYLKGKDGLWYQTGVKGPFRPGQSGNR